MNAPPIRTSITTFVVVMILFLVNYGAASSLLEGFAFVLMVGVITGTYSSISAHKSLMYE